MRQETLAHPVRAVAGVDVHYDEKLQLAFGAACLLDAASLELEESALAVLPVSFPYVTGLLSFREVPVALAALGLLSRRPDLVMVDGQGIAHPRRLGFAAHLGLLLDLPTLGCGKSRLCGTFEPPASLRGSKSELVHRGEIIGSVVRTRDGVAPLFVSVGHKVTLNEAIHWVLACHGGRRLPEPIRIADRLSRAHG